MDVSLPSTFNMSLSDLKKELLKNDRLLVFMDDSGTPGSNEYPLVKDFMISVAVLLNSDSYQKFLKEAKDSLQPFGDVEFHTTDVVSGKNDWDGICITQRLDLIEKWGKMLHEYATFIPYVNIGKRDYEKLASSDHPNIKELPKQKEGIRTALFNYILANSKNECPDKKFIVIHDNYDKTQNMVWHFNNLDKQTKLFRRCIFFQDSKNIMGLQLADLAGYIINRMHLIYARSASENNVIGMVPKTQTENVIEYTNKNKFDGIIFNIYKFLKINNKYSLITNNNH